MTIHLPNELESTLRAEVLRGRFASMDDAISEAARLLIRELRADNPGSHGPDESPADPILGCMRDDAALMDEIVADTYRQRRDVAWREFDL